MKMITITLLAAILGFIAPTLQAQNFVPTSEYTVAEKEVSKESEYSSQEVILTDKNNNQIANIVITDSDTFETILISTLENPGLEGIEKILKVEVEYLTCCAFVDSFYYLVTDQQEYTALAPVTNSYCEEELTETAYIFPNQEYGVANNILKTDKKFSIYGTLEYVTLKESYAWEDALNSELSIASNE